MQDAETCRDGLGVGEFVNDSDGVRGSTSGAERSLQGTVLILV